VNLNFAHKTASQNRIVKKGVNPEQKTPGKNVTSCDKNRDHTRKKLEATAWRTLLAAKGQGVPLHCTKKSPVQQGCHY
jgi:hypothetical protein